MEQILERDAALQRLGISLSGEKIIRRPELLARLGISRTTLWRMEQDATFPRAVPIGRRCNGYLASEVAAWFAARRPETRAEAVR